MVETFGLVLAGGLARRLGGVDKALIEVAGEPILASLLRRLEPQCAGVALNANGDAARFGAFGLAVVPDSVPGFAGPLAGVLAGLDFVADSFPNISYVASVPADTPFIPHDLVTRLRQALAGGARIAVARSARRDHHAIALWPVALRDDLRRALVEEELRKVSGFIGRYDSVLVEWPVDPYDPFFNVNRPEDLALAEKIASRAG
jgi:molybdopterin-guanine dinucleotide biosynthesis protein A